MTIFQELAFAMPELILAVGAMVLLLVGVFTGEHFARPISLASIALLLAAALVAALASEGEAVTIFDGAFRIDGFSAFAKVIVFVAAAFAIAMSERFLGADELRRFEYPILIVLAALGMALMVSANDLIALYMGVETQSLSLYVLAAFNRDSRRSTEAGLKYFVLGALSSCLLLYGASLIYGFSGSTNFEAIAKVLSGNEDNHGLLVGLVFLICGIAFKVSAAPFHMWTPDVYEGSPTPVTAFFAGAPKLAAMALFARTLVTPFTEAAQDWVPILAMLSVASMLVGAFSALRQTNIKRLMAYSSIGHMGYALIGLAAGGTQGVTSVLIYMSIYVVMTLGTFACILLMRRQGGMTESIQDLAGLSKTNMPLALLFTVLFFSLAGIPPMAGFLAKWYVFLAAVDAGLVWLAIVGAVTSVISAFYYLNIVRVIWFEEPAPVFEREGVFALSATAFLAAIMMFPILFVRIGDLVSVAEKAAASIF